MADDSSVFSFLALVMSGIAATIALLARRDSSRAAKAAEKSAETAEKSANEGVKARKVAQADLLSPHFQNVDYLLKVASGEVGSTATKVATGKESIVALNALIENTELHKLLSRLLGVIVRVEECSFSVAYGDDKKDEQELHALFDEAKGMITVFGRIKREYLNIG